MKRTALMIFAAFAAIACGRVCAPKTDLPIAQFCVPDGGAPAGTALTLMAMETCGGCDTSVSRCDVAVTGTTIALSLSGETCTLPPGTACTLACRISTFNCAVPALAPGQYTVTGVGASESPTKTLRVSDGGTASCAIAAF